MKSYSLLYADYTKQIITLIFAPLLFAAPLIVLAILIELPDTAMFITIMAGIFAAVGFTIYIMIAQVTSKVTIEITSKGIRIHQQKKTWFNRFDTMEIPFQNIRRITNDTDVQHDNKKFFMLKIKHPSTTICLQALKKEKETIINEFSNELNDAITNFNNSTTAAITGTISTGSFYTGSFATVLTVICYVLIVVITIALIVNPHSFPWYKAIWFYAVSAGWILNHRAAKKREAATK